MLPQEGYNLVIVHLLCARVAQHILRASRRVVELRDGRLGPSLDRSHLLHRVSSLLYRLLAGDGDGRRRHLDRALCAVNPRTVGAAHEDWAHFFRIVARPLAVLVDRLYPLNGVLRIFRTLYTPQALCVSEVFRVVGRLRLIAWFVAHLF